MDLIKNIRVLVVDDNPTRAEERLNIFRSDGFTLRPTLASTAEDFDAAIVASQWDLCLAADDRDFLSITDVINTLRQSDRDTPVIVVCEILSRETTKIYWQAGVGGVADGNNKESILWVAKRALTNLVQLRTIRKLEKRLSASERLCQHLLESSKDAIAYFDGLKLTYANPAFLHLFGYGNFANIEKKSLLQLVAANQDKVLDNFLKGFHAANKKSAVLHTLAKRDDGSEFSIEFIVQRSWHAGKSAYQLRVKELLENKTVDAEHTILGQRDLLTGLYNRQYCIAALDDILSKEGAALSTNYLLYIELEQLEELRSQLGMAEGDLLLSDAAKCIKAALDGDSNLASRYDDESFVLLMPNSSESEATARAEKIIKIIADHVSIIGNESFNIKCNIGVCQFNENSPRSQEVVARAYKACQEGKQTKQSLVLYHHKQTPAEDEANKKILEQINDALEHGNFQLKYQPIVSLHGEAKEYYEVVVRMLDQDNNVLRPDKFLAVANNAGLLNKIDRWIIQHAIKLLAKHRKEGHNSYLFIMLSEASICDATLLPWISAAMQEARLPSDAIIFEINETDAAANVEHAAAFTQGLKQLHCRTAVTHFGSGLNSFAVLKQLAVDFVKLDPLYAQALQSNIPEAKDELHAMITSIHAQGKLVLVPMVEDAKMMATLWQIGTNYIQGYFLSPPTAEMNYNFEGHLEELG